MLDDGIEILIDAPMAKRGRAMLEALAAAAPAGAVVTRAYTGQHPLLVMYGAGLASRAQARRQHLKAGGRVAMWDLGYWAREDAMRLSVDSMHPTAAQLALAPAGQWRQPMHLRNDADPAGPVLLIGLGPKSGALYGLKNMEWELAAQRRIQAQHPGREIYWRPKGKHATPLAGATLRHGMPIEQALAGCSLVVCRHSNVAVDACIAGVPVECEDGAARALYAAGPTPAPAERAEFLRQLGFWNWRPAEAVQAWEWIRKVTSS